MKFIRYRFSCACLIIAACVANSVYAANIVALISEVSGNVSIKVNGSSSPAKLLSSVSPGARVELLDNAKLSLIFVAKGDEYKLAGPGSYQIDETSLQTIKGKTPVKQASIGGALNGKRIRPENVAQATITMRSLNIVKHIDALSPSSQITLADPLNFRWKEPSPGLVYKIQLIDSQNKVVISKEVKENSFTLPQDIELIGGDYYVWNVSTTIPDGSVVTGDAKFRVASNELRTQAASLRPDRKAPVSERVAYGFWLESENLSREAQGVWEQLAEDFPDETNLLNRSQPKK